MPKIIFDIESTGLSRSESSPIEFAFLEVSDKGAVPMRHGCFYIKPYKNYWSEEAAAVHKITRQMLQEQGVDPEYAAANIYGLLHYNDLVTFNGLSFDMPLLRSFCDTIGTANIRERSHLDLCQKWHTGKKKLRDVVAEINLSDKVVAGMTRIIFGDDARFQPHDARYDVIETFYAYKHYLKEEEKRVQRMLDAATT